MTSVPELRPINEYSTWEEAEKVAHNMALHGYTIALPGILYQQGGRRFISIVMPLPKLFALTIPPPKYKRGVAQPDPEETRNRPLRLDHVKDIYRYMQKNDIYIMPPVILNCSEPLNIFAGPRIGPTRQCMVVLPDKDTLHITDGQHRIEGLRQIAMEKPDLEKHDAIGVTLVEELDLQRIHQDFWDAAQTKKIEPSFLVAYDMRAEANALVRAVVKDVSLFSERVDLRGAKIGINSLMLYSTNQIQQATFYLLLGEVKGKAEKIMERVNQMLAPAYDVWLKRVCLFFERIIALNPQWQEVMNHPLDAGHVKDPVPDLRKEYVHFSAGGLNVMCAAGHAILLLADTVDTFTPQQEELLKQLTNLDWTRDGELWRGHIVSTSGSITPHRGNMTLAIAKVKEHLGLMLTKAERTSLDKHLTFTTV